MVWDDIAELRLGRVLSVLCFLDRGFVAWTVAYDVQIWKLHRKLHCNEGFGVREEGW